MGELQTIVMDSGAVSTAPLNVKGRMGQAPNSEIYLVNAAVRGAHRD